VANYRLGSTRGPEMDLYHFIDFPKEANTYDQQRDCKLRNCIIEAIPSYLSVLSSLDDPRMRSVLLCVVAHLVGDIHQPLHFSCEGLEEKENTVQGQ